MPESNPIFAGGNKPRTFTAGAALTGGQVVALSAPDTVIAAGAGSLAVVGVVANDVALGGPAIVWPLAGVTHEVVAAGVIAVGDNLVSAAGGQVAAVAAVTTPTAADVTSTRAIIGVASTAAGAGGVKIQMVGR